MLTFTLAIPHLTTSNLPWFMDLTFQVPMQFAVYSIRLCFYHQSHPQLGVGFALVPSLHSFWSYFSTDLQHHIEYLPIWGVHLSVSYFLPFHTVRRVLNATVLKWFAIPFSSGSHFVRTLHINLPSWVDLPDMAHSFIELDKVVVHVVRLVSFLWLWFSVCLPSAGKG